MKILHVIPSMNPAEGGVAQAVRTMVKGLIQSGVQNEVVSFDEPGAAYLSDDRFIIYALGQKRGPWQYNKTFYPWLLANIAGFEVVIVHTLWCYSGYAIRKAMQHLKRKAHLKVLPKLFVMPHGMLDPYFQHAPGRKLKAIRNYFYWELIEKKLVNSADGILFTCDTEALLAREPFSGYKPRKDIVVGLGVENPPVFHPVMREAFMNSCKGLNHQPYLLFLSRIDEKKGVDILINAYLEAIKKAQVEQLPKLVIAGPGMNTAYGTEIQQQVESEPLLQQRVFLPGMLTGNTKWGAFYGCEAFILPSHQENFGVAVVEAMACGKPVLISDQVNIWKEIKQDGGCFVADDTLAGTRGLLDYWQEMTYSGRVQMGKNAYGSYRKYFSTSTATKKLLKAIADVQA